MTLADSVPLRVPFAGELDMASAPALEHALERAAAVAPGDVWVDLRECTFMDSAGVHCLLRLSRDLKGSGRRLIVTCADGPVRRTIEITGLDSLLEPGSSPQVAF